MPKMNPRIDAYAGLVLWKTASDELRQAALGCLGEIIDTHCDELVREFYDVLMAHQDGNAFLDNLVVEDRLSHALGAWLRTLVTTDLRAGIDDFVALQSRVGGIHARMKVPNHLVMQGASLLKSRIGCLVSKHSPDPHIAQTTLIMLDELFDYALNIMSEAYVTDIRDRAKVDEAFRLYNLGQDINLERETQRSALMEWSQHVLFELVGNQDRSDFSPLTSSPFGLWIRHRASMLFQDSPIIDAINAIIREVDEECLPAIVNSDPRSMQSLKQLHDKIEEIKFLLSDLFQSAAAIENGRDPLSRTLNRRFLSSVLVREVMLAKESGLELSVALIDADYFKQINDRFGHATGDLVLSHIAGTLLNTVRATDFVFRYGGEEFLVVFTETGLDEATRIADRLRRELADRPANIPDQGSIPVTVSIGVAQFEGHPDYEFMLRRADESLYLAKQGGRNRVIAAARAKAA